MGEPSWSLTTWALKRWSPGARATHVINSLALRLQPGERREDDLAALDAMIRGPARCEGAMPSERVA